MEVLKVLFKALAWGVATIFMIILIAGLLNLSGN